MKSKPIVMKHFSTVHTSYIVNFEFTNNITILTGASATGKTASFSFIRECMAVNPDIVCINYQDYQKDIKKLIASETGKLVVIDNADILINNEIRRFINFEFSNQYMLFLRNCDGLNVVRIDISHRTCRHIPCPGFVISPHFVCVNGNTINYV